MTSAAATSLFVQFSVANCIRNRCIAAYSCLYFILAAAFDECMLHSGIGMQKTPFQPTAKPDIIETSLECELELTKML